MRRFWEIFLFVGLLALVAGVTWRLLNRPPPIANWLRVETTPVAVAGNGFIVRVTPPAPAEVAPAEPPMLLSIDLHGFTSRREWLDSVASAPAQPLRAENSGALEFSMVVPDRADLHEIVILAYVSATGRWRDQQAMAKSARIVVHRANEVPSSLKPSSAALSPVAMYVQADDGPVHRRDVRAVSVFIALGWIICAFRLWFRPGVRFPHGKARAFIIAISLGAAAWELLPLEANLGELARHGASSLRLYQLRTGFQQWLTVGIVVSALAISLILGWRARRAGRQSLLMIALTGHFAITAAGFLSLHEIDAILARTVAALPLMQWLQLGAVATALAGVVGSNDPRSGR